MHDQTLFYWVKVVEEEEEDSDETGAIIFGFILLHN